MDNRDPISQCGTSLPKWEAALRLFRERILRPDKCKSFVGCGAGRLAVMWDVWELRSWWLHSLGAAELEMFPEWCLSMNLVTQGSGSQYIRWLFSLWPGFPETTFPEKRPDGWWLSYLMFFSSMRLPSFFHLLPCFPWVDLEVDWETQLVFCAFPWQRAAVVEGLTKTCSCIMASLR